MPDKKLPKFKPDLSKVITSGRNASAEAKRSFANERERRKSDQQNPFNTLLSPDEIAGDYFLTRGLVTTIDGKARPITLDDLIRFRENVKKLERDLKGSNKRLSGGITAKTIINRSWESDRLRANKEITHAMPVSYRAKKDSGSSSDFTSMAVTFQTNAGPNSDKVRHYAIVEFLDWGAVVASPEKAEKIVTQLLTGRLKIACDCARWKYFFRYVATIGKYTADAGENAFPKIRNPGVTGVACKHILRVVQMVKSSNVVKGYLTQAIIRARKEIDHAGAVGKVADLRAMADELAKESRHRRTVKATPERKKAESIVKQKAAKKVSAQKPVSDAAFIKNIMGMGFTEDQAKVMLATTKATK